MQSDMPLYRFFLFSIINPVAVVRSGLSMSARVLFAWNGLRLRWRAMPTRSAHERHHSRVAGRVGIAHHFSVAVQGHYAVQWHTTNDA